MPRGCRSPCRPSVDLRLPKSKCQKQQSNLLAKQYLRVPRAEALHQTFPCSILLEIRTLTKTVPIFGRATIILVLSSIAETLQLMSSVETLHLQQVNM